MISTSTKIVAGLAVAVLFSIQLVSLSGQIRPSSLRRACGDCHSNETSWPWYSRISPVSWLIAKDVREGRAHFNLSAWDQGEAGQEAPETRELCAEVTAGKMPPRSYARLHPSSKPNPSELAALCALPFAEPAEAGQ